MRGRYEGVADEGGVPGITTEPARLRGDETRRTKEEAEDNCLQQQVSVFGSQIAARHL